MALDVATSSDLIKIGGEVVSNLTDKKGKKTGNANSKLTDRKGKKTDNVNAEHHDAQLAIPAAGVPPIPIPATPTPPAVTQQGGIRYSDKLEAMIAMALENGGIDDYEMALLTKRAVKEGIDPDEFEFNLRMHLKKQNRQRDEIDNRSPVENLSMSLTMMEQYATGGERIVSPGDLSGALSLIPGVGQVAAVTGLLAAFIKTPSNLNNLKAEVIRCFSLPNNPEHLAQFISYAASQQEELIQQKENELSIQGLVSSLSFGKDLDLYPIWEKKIEEACEKAKMQYFNDYHLMQVVKKYQPSLINKLKSGRLRGSELDGILTVSELDGIVPPSDDEELLQVIEFAYNNNDSYYGWERFYSKMYKEGEYRFANNPQMMSRLIKYKKRGLFSKGVSFFKNNLRK